MFGGLDLKGSSSSADVKDKGKRGEESTAAPPVAAASAFSFFTGASAPASAPAPAPASGFSFLNATVAPQYPQKDGADVNGKVSESDPSGDAAAREGGAFGGNAASTTAVSAFSFLAGSAAAKIDDGKTDIPSPSGEVEVEVSESAATSGSAFSFLQPSPADPPVDETLAATESIAAAQAESDLKGFSFLAQSTAATDQSAPAPALPNPITSSVSNSSLDLASSDTSSLASAPPSSIPAGSGVVFGNAAAGMMNSKKPKKKRRPTSKIGVAATTSPPAVLAPPQTTTMAPANDASQIVPTREAAAEATRRAEEFLSEKMKQQVQQHSPPTRANDSATAVEDDHEDLTIPDGLERDTSSGPGSDILRVDSGDDDVVVAAKMAAQEAQHMQQQQKTAPTRNLSARMGLGGLFRSNRSSPPLATTAAPTAGIGVSGSGGKSSSKMIDSNSGRSSDPTVAEAATSTLNTEQAEAEQIDDMKDPTSDHDSLLREQVRQGGEEASITPIPSSFVPPAPTSPGKMSFMPPVPVKPDALMPDAAPSATTSGVAWVVEVPKPKTPTDLFSDLMEEFALKVSKLMAEVTRLRQHKSGLLQDRFVTRGKERLAGQQKAQAEAQQMMAAEAEDFELADQMGQLIDSRERERFEFAAILENIGRALKQLESQKHEVVSSVVSCFGELRNQLKKLKEEQESNNTENATEALAQFSQISKQLSIENERLQHDLKHLERDTELVEEERNELEAAISEQAGEFEQLRDGSLCRLKEVQEEIEELQKRLKAKQLEAARLRTEAHGHDESVLKVRVKFSRQLARVQKKEATLRDNREEWEIEKASYERQKEEHDSMVAAHSEALVARDELLNALGREVEMANTFESIVEREIGFEVSSAELDEELENMQENVVKSEAAVSEAKEVLQSATVSLTSLQDEVKDIEFRIPKLEETKKSAASRRDFKTAGKASKEIKELTSRLKECHDELEGEAQERKSEAENALKSLETELEEKRKIASEKERESGSAAMQQIADNIKRLVATKESVCESSNSKSIQGVGALVLQRQIQALKIEGQTYGAKYGGWNELLEGVGMAIKSDDRADNVSSHLKEELDGCDAEKGASESIKEDSLVAPSTEGSDEENSPNENGVAVADASRSFDQEKLKRFRELSKTLTDLQNDIERAALEEDFERAAELQDTEPKILEEIENLNLTDEEMEVAMTVDDANANANAGVVPTENSEDNKAPPECGSNTALADEEKDDTLESREVDLKSDAMERKEGGSSKHDEPETKTANRTTSNGE